MIHRLLLVLPLVLMSCRLTPDPTEPPPEEELRRRLLSRAIHGLQNGGSAEAEAVLAAAGERAVPHLRKLLDESSDPVLAARVRSILLYSGDEQGLSTAEQVDLLLFDLARDEPHPYLGLKALDRLMSLGEDAVPPLEEAARMDDGRGRAARRLLSRLREAH
jgi:hypothetical protein